MDDVHYYAAKVEWKDGRTGELTSPSFPSIKVATPPEFKNGVPNIWSPEHLFVASINICLMTTFLAIAENSGLEFISFTSEATGKLEKVDGKYMISEVELKPVVKIKDEKYKEKTLRILDKSEKGCLISNSAKSKIVLNPQITL
ncbi:MAG: OsmC family protein [Ignavibacteriaceae bacterium]